MPAPDDTTDPATSAPSKGGAIPPAGGMTYAAAGVDIEAGDKVVDRIKPVLKRTHGPRVMGLHGAFAGMFRLDFNESLFKRNYKDPVLVACTDGVGTKVMLAIEMGRLDTIGIDCVAMNVNDLIVQGAVPPALLLPVALYETRFPMTPTGLFAAAPSMPWKTMGPP